MSGSTTVLRYSDPRPDKERWLLVMLPGAGIAAEDFAAQGLVAAAQAGRVVMDVIAAKPDQLLYLDGGVAPVLQQSVIAPALAAGYHRLWLLGISLGGMGALSCAAAHVADIDGLILLAPFIGTPGTVAELTRAGGFGDWRVEASAATLPERQVLCWLQARLGGAPGPQIWLGHATKDRFAAGHRLLAAALPRRQAVLVDGCHNWDAWRAAFLALMDRIPFG